MIESLAPDVAAVALASFADGLVEFLQPSTFVGVLVDGLAKAALYVMIASGLTLIFGLLGVLNFAHGSLTMVGAYLGGLFMVSVAASASGWTVVGLFLVGLVVVFGVLAGAGGAIEVGLIRRLYDQPPIYQILLTFGLTLVIDEALRIVLEFYGIQPISDWQDALGTKPEMLAGSLSIGPLSVSGLALFEILLGVLTVAGVWGFLTRTRYGLYIRAGSEDAEMAEALGIDIRRVFTLVFAVGSGLAGAAGILLMWDPVWAASIDLGAETLLPAFVVVIIGGLGTFRGTVVAALLVGLADAVSTWWFVNVVDWTWLPQVTVFLMLVVMLAVRPKGLFGVEGVGGH